MQSIVRRVGPLAAGLFLVLAAAVQAAPTGYVDDFSGPMRGWVANKTYKLTQKDGALTLDVSKQTRWTGQYLDLGGVHDFSAHPYVNLRAKSDTPCILHVYLDDGRQTDLRERRIQALSGYVDLCYDFTDTKKVDLTKVKGMIFTVNGAANSWAGRVTFDELKVGDAARRLAGIEGVHDQTDYRDTGRHTLLLTGIDGAASFTVSGADALIRGCSVGPVKDGLARLSYDCIPGATGRAEVTVTAVGGPGYSDNAVSFPLTVEDNLPPTVDRPEDLLVQAGKPCEVHLTGISDGNIAAEQPLTFSVTSSDAAVVAAPDVRVSHAAGSPYATLSFTPKASGATTLALTLNDNAGGDESTSASFQVRAVSSWNNPPTVDPVPDQTVFTGAGGRQLTLTGIGDGDSGRQPLRVTTSNSDPALVTASVDYAGGATAALHLTPTGAKTGTATVTVRVQDGGGAPDNNGDQSAQVSFRVVVRPRPLTGWKSTFADWTKEDGRLSGQTGILVGHEVLDGRSVVKVVCKDKITFGGLWLKVPDLDISKAPCLTVDVKPQDALQFNAYFYDGTGRRNIAAHQMKTLTAGEWQTVTFDFTGAGEMSDAQGKPIDASWITGVLLNFHPKLSWPFTRYSGTILFRNVRIGADADVPKHTPPATLDEVPDQVCLEGAGRREVTLSGIGSGSTAAPHVTAAASPDGVLGEVTVGKVGPHGTAPLTYDVGARAGRADVRVTVSPEGSKPRTVPFSVDVLDPQAQPAAVSVDCSRQHQVICGLGFHCCLTDPAVESLVRDLGASIMRQSLLENQVEPVNDNSDPNVLYEGALNRKVFDFARMRKLQADGLEGFIVNSFSPPAWMKTNMSTNYQGADAEHDTDKATNRLDLYQYDEFAESMVALARVFREEGVNLYAIGFQNEPAFCEPYASAILDPSHFVKLIKVAGRHFQAEGVHPRLFMPEEVFTQKASLRAYIAALTADPEAQKLCGAVACHYGYKPGALSSAAEWRDVWQRAQGGARPEQFWVSETGISYRDWPSAMQAAVALYRALEDGNVSLWATLPPGGRLARPDRQGPILDVWAPFFRHIRPGARRVTSTSSAPDVLATSYVNDAAHGGALVCVLINTADAARAVRLTVSGRTAPARLRLTRTDRVDHDADAGSAAPGDLILLPPASVTAAVAAPE